MDKKEIQQKLNFYKFTPVTAHDAQVNRILVAEALQKEIESRAKSTSAAPIKNPVGRPKRVRDASKEMMAAAASSSSSSSDSNLNLTDESDPKKARGEYKYWFNTPYIKIILAACEANHYSFRAAVSALRKKNPLVFERLSHTTLHGWFEKVDNEYKLKSHPQSMLQDHAAHVRGKVSALQAYPEVEEELVSIFNQLRAAGQSMNRRIMRVIMKSILLEKRKEVLDTLKLSNSFISSWVHKKLNWSWRSATTAASKLPADWENQGINMAKRIAANMEQHKVSNYIIHKLSLYQFRY